jgi:hypothetical protein
MSTNDILEKLRADGHRVELIGSTVYIDGVAVLPEGQTPFGNDCIGGKCERG